eukprot:COSAG04_NODE_827_length_10036_cov_6.659455_11_plen_109_part_00
MRAAKTEPKPHALRSASASTIVYVNHANQEVVIRDGIYQGSGGAPDGGTASKAQDEGQGVSRTYRRRLDPIANGCCHSDSDHAEDLVRTACHSSFRSICHFPRLDLLT